MTAQNPITDSANWQNKYTAGQSQWQDIQRTGKVLIVSVFLLVIAILYVVGYATDRFDQWLFETTSQTLFYIFLLRVLLVILTPIIIVYVGLHFIFKQAGELVNSVYQLQTDEKLSIIIRTRLLGIPPLPPPLNSFIKYPTILITKPEFDEKHWSRWLGGPATLVIFDGFAAYLEHGNKFSRVVGASFPPPFLERYEHIKEIIDLRPQNRKGYVEPWTKDGIQIKLFLNVEVQINVSAEAQEKSSNVLYPFDPVAVKAAVEYTSVRLSDTDLQEQNWVDGAWGAITGAINAFVAGHSLDELFIAPQANNHHLNAHYLNNETPEHIEQIFSQRILDQVINNVSDRLHNNGIHVSNIQITQLDVPEHIRDLRTRYWESVQLKISAQRNSRAEADRIRIREMAHAEAQRTMLTTIINKLENVGTGDLTESLVLSLSGVLDQNLEDPIVRSLIAKEAFAVLDRIRKLLHEPF